MKALVKRRFRWVGREPFSSCNERELRAVISCRWWFCSSWFGWKTRFPSRIVITPLGKLLLLQYGPECKSPTSSPPALFKIYNPKPRCLCKPWGSEPHVRWIAHGREVQAAADLIRLGKCVHLVQPGWQRWCVSATGECAFSQKNSVTRDGIENDSLFVELSEILLYAQIN